MRKCKKVGSVIISLLLVLGMLSPSFVIPAYAVTAPSLSVDSKEVTAGDDFSVAVKIQNAANSVYNGNFTLQYDNSKLEIQSFTYGTIFNDHTRNCNLDYQSKGNLIRMTFSGAYALTQDGVLVTFTFKAKENVSGTGVLQFTAYKLYDENGSSLGGTATGSSITISSKPVISPQLFLTGGAVDAGEVIAVPIKISNAAGVYNGNFTLQYDSSLLTAESFAYGSIFNDHTKNCNLNYQSTGNQIRFTFSGAYSLTGDGTLVTITFKAKENTSGTANLNFTAYKMYDENGNALSTGATGGKIDVYVALTPLYTVSYNANGGSGAPASQTVEEGTTFTVSSDIPTRNDYTFTNWNTRADGTGTAYNSGSSFTVNNDIILYAQWTKNVTPKIVIENQPEYIYSGESYQFAATTEPSGLPIKWTSTIPGVVSITREGGLATAAKPGDAEIIASITYNGNTYTKSVPVRVINKLTAISVYTQPDKTEYFIGDLFNSSGLTIKQEFTYDNGVTYLTSSYEIGDYDFSSAGEKTVEIIYEDLKTYVTVQVLSPSVLLSVSNKSMKVGETTKLTATTTPSGQPITWTSSSTNIATVSNGTITAKATGTAIITARFAYNGVAYSTTCSVTVTPVEKTLSSIAINSQPTKTTYEIGESLNTEGLTLKLTYSDNFTEIVSNGFTTSGFNSETAGNKTVTVSYNGKTATFAVNVKANVVNENDPQMVVETKTVRAGETVTLLLSVKNAPTLKSIALSEITYDSSALELIGGEWKLSDSILQNWNSSNNTAAIAFSDNHDANGTIFALTFKVKDRTADGEYPVSCSITAKHKDGSIENNVMIYSIPGDINVVSIQKGDVNGDDQVNSDDAIYLLYYTLLPDLYPINQVADFDGSGDVNSDDAIYLLYHTLLPDIYPLR